MTSTSQLNGIFYITWQECMWWYWRHNQRSSCIQQSTKNNWSDLNSQRRFWVLHPKHNWHPSFFLYLLKKCDLLSQCWLNDLRTVEPCQELACIIAFVFPKITNVSFIAEFLVIKCLRLSLCHKVLMFDSCKLESMFFACLRKIGFLV